MITVVNKHTHKATPLDFYIGRGSPLGNQWTARPGRMHLAKYRASTKEEAIDKYTAWLSEQMQDENSYVRKEVYRILHAARTHDVNLVCYCAPRPCHGDVIKALVTQLLR